MKIALVHDFLVEYGGAERVLEALHEIWPEAPIYTAFVNWDGLGPHADRIAGWEIKRTFLQKVPGIKRLYSPLRLLSLLAFESLDLTSFDVVISSCNMYMAKGIVVKPQTIHISYLHSVPRFLYGYTTARNWRRTWLGRVFGGLLNHKMRQMDFLASQRPDYLLCNSLETQARIAKFYRREAAVIYPPVGIGNLRADESCHPEFIPISSRILDKVGISGSKALRRSKMLKPVQHDRRERNVPVPGTRPLPSRACGISFKPGLIVPRTSLGGGRDYYLCVSRLFRAKRIALAIKACKQLKLPLVVVGRGREERELKSIAGPETVFLGEVTDEELTALYRDCEAFIFPAEQEDFGIVPVEAMSFGKSVIALAQGGVKETVIDGKTGVLFAKPEVENLVQAIKRFKNLRINREDCVLQARKFSKERFKKEIREFLNKVLKNNG